jgi:hypothetical protein
VHRSSAPRTSPHDLNTNGKPRTPERAVEEVEAEERR